MQFLCFADVRCRLDWSNESHRSSGKACFPSQNAETKTSALTQTFSGMPKGRHAREWENRGKGSWKKQLCHGHQHRSKICSCNDTTQPISTSSVFPASSRIKRLWECKMDLLMWNDVADLRLPVGRSQWWMHVGWERCWPVKERDQRLEKGGLRKR